MKTTVVFIFLVLLPAYVAYAETTGRIDVGQKPQSPVITNVESMNETGAAAEEGPEFGIASLIIFTIAILLVAASIYLIGRHK